MADTDRNTSKGDDSGDTNGKVTDDFSSSAITHINQELQAANERLRQTALNFSIEWKAFLAYAMKMSVSAILVTTSSSKDELKENLLQSHGGLTILRNMETKPERKWQELFNQYVCVPPAPTSANAEQQDLSSEEHGKNNVITRLLELNKWKREVCQMSLARARLIDDERIERKHLCDHAQISQLAVMKALTRTMTMQHRLMHSSHQNDCVTIQDIESLLQFSCEKHRMSTVMERFFIRLRYLCKSHRYHLRHRMLALVHQQQSNNTIMLGTTAIGDNLRSSSHSPAHKNATLHCPLFILSRAHLRMELQKLLRAVSLPSLNVHANDSLTLLKLRADQRFADVVKATMVHLADVNTDIKAEERKDVDGESIDPDIRETLDQMELLLCPQTIQTRWDLIQHGYLQGTSDINNKEHQPLNENVTVSDTITDALLRSEWEMLSLNDIDYIRTRVNTLAHHFERAKVTVQSAKASSNVSKRRNVNPTCPEYNHRYDTHQTPKSNNDGILDPEELYSLYLLRVISCRCSRYRLLRLLNYFHYIALYRQQRSNDIIGSTIEVKFVPPSDHKPMRWRAVKHQDEYIIVWDDITHQCQLRDSSNLLFTKDAEILKQEFIFPAARRDLEAIEQQLLRMASVFIRKQECESLPSSEEDPRNTDEVVAIDRMQVLCDLYESELHFQQAKLQLLQLLLLNGLEYTKEGTRNEFHDEWERSSSVTSANTDAIVRLMRQRPLIDFTYSYFYESYAIDILKLELQINLQQEIQQYFVRCERNDQIEVNHQIQTAKEDDEESLIFRNIIRRDLLLRFQHHQHMLLQEAESQWFCGTSVGKLHALHQAIYETMLVTWKLVIKVELPTSVPIQSLERNGSDLLRGNGWQLVISPLVISDVCRNVKLNRKPTDEASPTSEPSLVSLMQSALEIMDWHQHLAHSVYEANCLELIYHFQLNFIDQKDVSDQARLFFFKFSSCEDRKNAALQPIAMELAQFSPDGTFLSITANYSGNKTVAEWLEMQLLDSQIQSEGTEAGSCIWRSKVLHLQQQWSAFLDTCVRYHDLIASDVFEFASFAPFALASSLTDREISAHIQQHQASPTQIMAVQPIWSKYADEIREKMKEEMERSCLPYWISLAQLKVQLQQRFVSNNNNHMNFSARDSGEHDILQVDVDGLYQYLEAEMTVPRLLVQIDGRLQSFRNEEELLVSIGAATIATFRTKRRIDEFAVDDNEDNAESALTKWLVSKLQQLKLDLKIQQGHDPSYRSRPASLSSGLESEEKRLFLNLPSTRFLLGRFGVTLCREQPAIGANLNVSGQRIAYLQSLDVIIALFCRSVDIVRVHCGLTFASHQHITDKLGRYRMKSAHEGCIDYNGAVSMHSVTLLAEWQKYYHGQLRVFHNDLLAALSPAAAHYDIFGGADQDQLQMQHRSMVLRQEIESTLRRFKKILTRSVQCLLSFLWLQTIGKEDEDGTWQQLFHQRSSLLNLAAQLNSASDSSCSQYQLEDDGVLFWKVIDKHQAREILSFKKELHKKLHDEAYIHALIQWLDLQRIFVSEWISRQNHCHFTKQRGVVKHVIDPSITNSQRVLSHPKIELEVVIALRRVWERFHLLQENHQDEAVEIEAHSADFIVSGKSLRTKEQLLGFQLGSLSSAQGSFAQACLIMSVSQHRSTQGKSMEVLLPPSTQAITQAKEFLRLYMELEWVEDNIKQLQTQYEDFLRQRKQDQHHRGTLTNTDIQKEDLRPIAIEAPLLALSSYYRSGSIKGPRIAHSDKQPDQNGGIVADNNADDAEYVIPVLEMQQFLHTITAQCAHHQDALGRIHEEARNQLELRCQTLQHANQKLECKLLQQQRDETVRREAFAADRAYHLHFQMEAVKKKMDTLVAHKELEQQKLRYELSEEYERKLQEMHIQLSSKQQQFAEYRTLMQHDLHQQLQGAQSQFMTQLVDHSGRLSVESKTTFLDTIRGQQALDQLHKENVTLKQTILKLQTLMTMQQEMQAQASNREQILLKRHAMEKSVLESEVTQLRQYTKQLDSDMNKLSEEKMFFQLKWTSMQKQAEVTAQKRREAKIRALFAPYHRAEATAGIPGGVSDPNQTPSESDKPSEPIAAVFGTLTSARKAANSFLDFENQREAFENQYERELRGNGQPTAHESAQIANQKRLEDHFMNSTRHYQNEIRRLQQQVVKESKLKAALLDQLTANQSHLNEEIVENQIYEHPEEDRNQEQQSRQRYRSPRLVAPSSESSHLTVVTLSPRRAQSASACTPNRPTQTPGIIAKRPSTSFSPRTSSFRAQVMGTAAASSSPRPSSSSSVSSTRRFRIEKRNDTNVGGIKGVPNAFSIREPLPYR